MVFTERLNTYVVQSNIELHTQGQKMKSFFKKIIGVFEAVNRARVATQFSRMGRNDLAREILLKD